MVSVVCGLVSAQMAITVVRDTHQFMDSLQHLAVHSLGHKLAVVVDLEQSVELCKFQEQAPSPVPQQVDVVVISVVIWEEWEWFV